METPNPTGMMDELAQVWLERIKNSEEYHDAWSKRFKCDRLEKYYMGDQWDGNLNNYEPYTINLIFSSIENKLPSLLFSTPVFHVKSKPQGSEYDFEDAIKRSNLRGDVLNTIVTDKRTDFSANIEASTLDAFFRFGIIEVGYEANWIVNPNAGKPILRSDNTPYTDGDNNVISQPEALPESERLYVKRIPAKRFRVGGLQLGPNLDQCNWCGYWEWVRVEDIKANKNLKNLDQIDWAGARSTDFVKSEFGMEVDNLVKSGDLVKIWKIWDNRKKKFYIFTEAHTLTLYEKPYERLPLFGLRFHKLPDGWLPMPPVSNWKSPQDEYNESREQARNHRRRFQRKYLYNKGAFPEEEELDKLINGGDGTFVGTSTNDMQNAAIPLQNAELGQGAQIGLTVTKDDFNIISATSEEQRGQADRTTATQANIINQKAQIRDTRARIQIAEWLSQIGRELLLLAEEKYTCPIWIRIEVPQGNLLDSIQDVSHIWQEISAADFKNKGEDDFNFDVSISLDSMSPVESETDRQAFLLFVATMQQYPELSADPLLVRETAYRTGYRNEQVIKRMQQAAQMMLVQKLQALAAASTPTNGGSQLGQQTVANATPPPLQNIKNQLSNQLGNGIPVV